MRQRHAHDLLARREHGHEGGEVGLGPGVRLHVGVLRAEELLQAVDGELLDLVDDLAAAVVAAARVALGVLVGERGAHGVDHGAAREVLAGDQLQSVALPAQLPVDQVGNKRIGVPEAGVVVETHPVLLFDFRDPPRMPAAGEFGLQPGLGVSRLPRLRSGIVRGG